MSMEIFVLSDVPLTSMALWQHAIDEDGFALRLSAQVPLTQIHGALPVRINEIETSFECTKWDVADILATYPRVRLRPHLNHAMAFRWGGDLDAGIAAYAAAASYARATEGIVLDCAEGKIITAKRAREIAVEMDQSRAQFAQALRRIAASFGN